MVMQLDTSMIDLATIADPPSDLPTVAQDARFWGIIYQTTDNASEELVFIQDVLAYRNAATPNITTMLGLAQQVREADIFAGDQGTDPGALARVVGYIALHESEGCRFDQQEGGGPARSWWQIEPRTAFSLIKNSSAEWGPKAAAFTGHAAHEIAAFTAEQMNTFLLSERNACVMAHVVVLMNARAHHLIDYLTPAADIPVA